MRPGEHSWTLHAPHNLLPPLAKGRWPSEARSEGWLRCREEYRYDRRVTTGTLQQKMGRIAPYTQRYYVPLRLHPPVSFADSPPCQGGPRGSALNRRSTTLRTTQSLLPPLTKGRTVRGTVRCNPGAATINHGGPPKAVEGWLRCRQQYRCDRSVTTAGLSPSTIPLPPARACALRAVLFLQSSLFSLVILS